MNIEIKDLNIGDVVLTEDYFCGRVIDKDVDFVVLDNGGFSGDLNYPRLVTLNQNSTGWYRLHTYDELETTE